MDTSQDSSRISPTSALNEASKQNILTGSPSSDATIEATLSKPLLPSPSWQPNLARIPRPSPVEPKEAATPLTRTRKKTPPKGSGQEELAKQLAKRYATPAGILENSVLRDAKEVLQEQQIERKKKKRGRPRKNSGVDESTPKSKAQRKKNMFPPTTSESDILLLPGYTRGVESFQDFGDDTAHMVSDADYLAQKKNRSLLNGFHSNDEESTFAIDDPNSTCGHTNTTFDASLTARATAPGSASMDNSFGPSKCRPQQGGMGPPSSPPPLQLLPSPFSPSRGVDLSIFNQMPMAQNGSSGKGYAPTARSTPHLQDGANRTPNPSASFQQRQSATTGTDPASASSPNDLISLWEGEIAPPHDHSFLAVSPQEQRRLGQFVAPTAALADKIMQTSATAPPPASPHPGSVILPIEPVPSSMQLDLTRFIFLGLTSLKLPGNVNTNWLNDVAHHMFDHASWNPALLNTVTHLTSTYPHVKLQRLAVLGYLPSWWFLREGLVVEMLSRGTKVNDGAMVKNWEWAGQQVERAQAVDRQCRERKTQREMNSGAHQVDKGV